MTVKVVQQDSQEKAQQNDVHDLLNGDMPHDYCLVAIFICSGV